MGNVNFKPEGQVYYLDTSDQVFMEKFWNFYNFNNKSGKAALAKLGFVVENTASKNKGKPGYNASVKPAARWKISYDTTGDAGNDILRDKVTKLKNKYEIYYASIAQADKEFAAGIVEILDDYAGIGGTRANIVSF